MIMTLTVFIVLNFFQVYFWNKHNTEKSCGPKEKASWKYRCVDIDMLPQAKWSYQQQSQDDTNDVHHRCNVLGIIETFHFDFTNSKGKKDSTELQ